MPFTRWNQVQHCSQQCLLGHVGAMAALLTSGDLLPRQRHTTCQLHVPAKLTCTALIPSITYSKCSFFTFLFFFFLQKPHILHVFWLYSRLATLHKNAHHIQTCNMLCDLDFLQVLKLIYHGNGAFLFLRKKETGHFPRMKFGVGWEGKQSNLKEIKHGQSH